MLPVLNVDRQSAMNAFVKLMDSQKLLGGKTFAEWEFTSKGLKAWENPILGPYNLYTTGKQFNKVEDFKGVLLRGSSRVQRMFLSIIGATPVTLSSVELYDGLSKKTIDGTFYPHSSAYTDGLSKDLLKYMIQGVDFGFYNSQVMISTKKWDSLPPDIQQLIEKSIRGNVDGGMKALSDQTELAKQELTANKALIQDFSNMDPALKEAILKAVSQTWSDWIEIAAKQGEPALETAKYWKELISEQGGEVPDVKGF
jgi:TRAP-type C4-dicarboxylate transport system substrate-binding protein